MMQSQDDQDKAAGGRRQQVAAPLRLRLGLDEKTAQMTGVSRSENMRRIRSKDTKPEMMVRRLVHALGYRYRLHRKDLPGKPDLAFIGRRKVVFVHGCFWHQHLDKNCSDARLPRSRPDYWLPKLERNTKRDAEHITALHALGWQVLVIWECETKDRERLAQRLAYFLN